MKCLLDMDGVLVDFVTSACKKLEVDYIYTKENKESHGCFDMEKLIGISSNEFWSKIKGYEFWRNLAPMPEFSYIISAVTDCFGEGNVSLLSSPSNDSECLAAKYEWIIGNLPKFGRRYLLGPCKQFCAGPDHILIDDYDRNVEKFRQAGGRAILFPRPWNSRHAEYFALIHNNPELVYDLLVSDINETMSQSLKQSVYYAHCIGLYDTEQEKRDIEAIESLGYDVFNPNSPECDAGYKEKGMEFFKDIVQDQDIFMFRSLPDGSIPAGVANEIRYAKEKGIPIIELPTGVLKRELSVDLTREYLKEVGYR